MRAHTIDVDVLSLDDHEPNKATGVKEPVPAGLTLPEVQQEHTLQSLHAEVRRRAGRGSSSNPPVGPRPLCH
jgi:hypothetical protein